MKTVYFVVIILLAVFLFTVPFFIFESIFDSFIYYIVVSALFAAAPNAIDFIEDYSKKEKEKVQKILYENQQKEEERKKERRVSEARRAVSEAKKSKEMYRAKIRYSFEIFCDSENITANYSDNYNNKVFVECNNHINSMLRIIGLKHGVTKECKEIQEVMRVFGFPRRIENIETILDYLSKHNISYDRKSSDKEIKKMEILDYIIKRNDVLIQGVSYFFEKQSEKISAEGSKIDTTILVTGAKSLGDGKLYLSCYSPVFSDKSIDVDADVFSNATTNEYAVINAPKPD